MLGAVPEDPLLIYFRRFPVIAGHRICDRDLHVMVRLSLDGGAITWESQLIVNDL